MDEDRTTIETDVDVQSLLSDAVFCLETFDKSAYDLRNVDLDVFEKQSIWSKGKHQGLILRAGNKEWQITITRVK